MTPLVVGCLTRKLGFQSFQPLRSRRSIRPEFLQYHRKYYTTSADKSAQISIVITVLIVHKAGFRVVALAGVLVGIGETTPAAGSSHIVAGEINDTVAIVAVIQTRLQ